MSRSVKAHLLLVFATLVWGATFVQIKSALEEASPLLFNAVRMALAATALVVVFRKNLRQMSRGALGAGITVGTFLWLGYEFQTTGLKLTTPSKSAFLTGVSVVLVPVFLAVFWRGRVNRWTSLGVLAAFLGLYLLTVPATESGAANWESINRGDVLTMGCAIGFAFQIIFIGRATKAYPFEQIATLQAVTCAVLMAVSVPIGEKAHMAWTGNVVAAIFVTGLLGTAAAFAIQAWAQQFTPPTHTALIFSLEPVFAWITSYVVLGERLGRRAGFGALLILAGVLLSELKGTVRDTASELGSAAQVDEA